jgi:endonuclease G, mitochondrial
MIDLHRHRLQLAQASWKADSRPAFGTDAATTSRVSTKDSNGGGYSRGHIAPRFAISSRLGTVGNDATFIMSNVYPQFQDYNDGQWADLEEWIAGKKKKNEYIKGWADEYENVWVTVGPIFDEDREPLECGVEVLNAFYCIVVDEDGSKPRALAFILEHKDQRHADLKADLTTIREIEQRTELNFFNQLPQDVQDRLETTQSQDLWPLPVHPN